MQHDPNAMLNRMIRHVIEEVADTQQKYRNKDLPANETVGIVTTPVTTIVKKLRDADLPDQVILDKLVELEKGGAYIVSIQMVK